MCEGTHECRRASENGKQVEILLPRTNVKIYRCLVTVYWSILFIAFANPFPSRFGEMRARPEGLDILVMIGVWIVPYWLGRKTVGKWILSGRLLAVLLMHLFYYFLLGWVTYLAITEIIPEIMRPECEYLFGNSDKKTAMIFLFIALGIFYWVGVGSHVISFMRLNGRCPECREWAFGEIKTPCERICGVCGVKLEFVCRYFEAYSFVSNEKPEEGKTENAVWEEEVKKIGNSDSNLVE